MLWEMYSSAEGFQRTTRDVKMARASGCSGTYTMNILARLCMHSKHLLLSRSNINKYPVLQDKTIVMGQQSLAQYSSSEQSTLSSISVEEDEDEWWVSFVWFTGSSPAGMQASAFTMTNPSQHSHEDNQELCPSLIFLPRIAEFISLWP